MIHYLDVILSIVKSGNQIYSSYGVSVISDTPDIANVVNPVRKWLCGKCFDKARMSMKNRHGEKCVFFNEMLRFPSDSLTKKTEIIKMHKAPENPSEYAMILENDKGDRREIVSNIPKFYPIMPFLRCNRKVLLIYRK